MLLERKTSPNGVVFYASPQLEGLHIPHAFSTRIGGVSAAPFDSLNLGHLSGCANPDTDENIEENYRRLQAATSLAGRRRCSVHQVHGATVLTVSANQPWDRMRQADALVTSDPQTMLAVRVADCVPVLIAGRDAKTVAAIHAGWRGVVAGIVPAALTSFPNPREVTVAIGPSISASAFEVGPEVVEQFRALFGNQAPIATTTQGTPSIDLPRAIQLQLTRAGVPAHHIDTTDRCTFRDAPEFYSHRRDRGLTGRMAAVIGTAS